MLSKLKNSPDSHVLQKDPRACSDFTFGRKHEYQKTMLCNRLTHLAHPSWTCVQPPLYNAKKILAVRVLVRLTCTQSTE
jgi:hypothetical protein